jgi:hypothetical protein
LVATGASTFPAGSAGAPSITTSGDTNTGIFFPAADTIAFTEGGVEGMRIDSSGNLGIGTTSPVFGAGSGVELVRSGTATYRAVSNGQGVEYRNNAGTAEIDTRGAFPIVLLTNQTERMRILSDGKVGIGTSTPGTAFEVNTSSTLEGVRIRRFSGAYYSELRQTDNPEGLAFLVGDGSTVAERARITGTGLFQMNSGYGSVATAFGCRAWVNFNGSSPTVRGSGNVTSVTKQSTGNFTINLTNAMPDTNGAVVGGKSNIPATHVLPGINLYVNSTSAIVMQVYESNGSFADSAENFVAVFR